MYYKLDLCLCGRGMRRGGCVWPCVWGGRVGGVVVGGCVTVYRSELHYVIVCYLNLCFYSTDFFSDIKSCVNILIVVYSMLPNIIIIIYIGITYILIVIHLQKNERRIRVSQTGVSHG